MFSIGAIFLIFLMMLGFSIDKAIEVTNTEKFTALRNECLKLAGVVMNVFLNGHNAEIFTSISYNASVDPGNRLITMVGDRVVTCPIHINQTANVNLASGVVILKNIGNFVNISNG